MVRLLKATLCRTIRLYVTLEDNVSALGGGGHLADYVNQMSIFYGQI